MPPLPRDNRAARSNRGHTDGENHTGEPEPSGSGHPDFLALFAAGKLPEDLSSFIMISAASHPVTCCRWRERLTTPYAKAIATFSL